MISVSDHCTLVRANSISYMLDKSSSPEVHSLRKADKKLEVEYHRTLTGRCSVGMDLGGGASTLFGGSVRKTLDFVWKNTRKSDSYSRSASTYKGAGWLLGHQQERG